MSRQPYLRVACEYLRFFYDTVSVDVSGSLLEPEHTFKPYDRFFRILVHEVRCDSSKLGR